MLSLPSARHLHRRLFSSSCVLNDKAGFGSHPGKKSGKRPENHDERFQRILKPSTRQQKDLPFRVELDGIVVQKPTFSRNTAGRLVRFDGTAVARTPPPTPRPPKPASIAFPDLSFEMSTRRKRAPLDDKARAQKRANKLRKVRPDPSSPDDVLYRDILEVLGEDHVDAAIEAKTEFESPFEKMEEAVIEIVKISADGRGLGIAPQEKGKPWAVVVPHVFPGETVRVKCAITHRMYTGADLLEVIKPNPEYRDNSLIQCKYFGECGGCQYQMVPYEKQLAIKRNVVKGAYKLYSYLEPSEIPEVLETIGSPLQYGYRTKLTPHFDLRKNRAPEDPIPPIGYNRLGKPGVLDIEECVIGTKAVNEGLTTRRAEVETNINTYKKGATLLLRESLETTLGLPLSNDLTDEQRTEAVEKKICVSNAKTTVRERVGDVFFEYGANSFFQNNNSVLPPLIEYTRKAIFPEGLANRPTHLIDTYCGAGLFGIALAKEFERVSGVELSADSILAAKRNAQHNNLSADTVSFRAGDASDIFKVVSDFPPEKTAIIIDPPRKGCSDDFVKQVVALAPQTIVYVSCNVHSQARDVGNIIRGMKAKEGGKRYNFESVRGFDLFPQTHHVEGVAVLRLVEA
ncbi:S-adenosyl-L-methionine-dependent methyltransferase [Cylindrobasidium torrendii FP15055 ss-10]|uniref:S-adenosyl-L-methionine-dependent methyltransferase n=1 Tax=Cylindrobasidium torrendii FP15055 ss-10 TaxID=1314674 RepID=A0A0D7BES6_9AGAR|nr:S-adenosyl-L-methionine-dependent methyltransferase [Cylindrobasidium torrendii FP15055 ss-10]